MASMKNKDAVFVLNDFNDVMAVVFDPRHNRCRLFDRLSLFVDPSKNEFHLVNNNHLNHSRLFRTAVKLAIKQRPEWPEPPPWHDECLEYIETNGRKYYVSYLGDNAIVYVICDMTQSTTIMTAEEQINVLNLAHEKRPAWTSIPDIIERRKREPNRFLATFVHRNLRTFTPAAA